ncbi:MAG: D-alanine--D-alanine ligase A, partial [Acidobacteriota bacterium]
MAQRIGLVFGGRSVEHKVSVVSARTVDAALAGAGFTVVPLGIAQTGAWVAPDVGRRALDGELDELGASEAGDRSVVASLGPLVDAGVDVIFPIAHGTWGEDGTLQGLCEMLDLPYVGTGVASSAVCMD